ncbi:MULTISPECIES: ABC transporter substrate-binding protein [Mycolicibacterium]|uniref:ABC transporter arginine-binding protein 1 n=1 Tax=Mycolicibacterium mageritense TaxID=53462 RepID=A0AAI8U041_MYCME|nr:ABC transporter substrate-binding protein [Mycolicibacterium mageritense]TXI56908.1 MAG: amino acid ABC transporter substrate-binding protein [Mycolicibacterium mageritense]BDY31670.1 ABC transporter arginine-binding protein 1 [Mycolicibacterium mageritense]GJJ20654.1 amino acid ABC transporter substrate-binding protein [Mycolicibacterium mageritense]
MSTLRAGIAVPDPPFNSMPAGGLDLDLIAAIAEKLDRTLQLVEYPGDDFEGIFDGLSAGSYDCVIAGTTVTPERQRKAAFVPPYLISGQGLAVDTNRLPHVRSVDDLAGLTIGVQHGNTSRPIAERLVAEGRAGRVRVYGYGAIREALHDLSTGGCDAVIKLAPVLTELVKALPAGVDVVQRKLSIEEIAIAVAPRATALLDGITAAQADLEADGTLQQIRRKWLGNPFTDQHLAGL